MTPENSIIKNSFTGKTRTEIYLTRLPLYEKAISAFPNVRLNILAKEGEIWQDLQLRENEPAKTYTVQNGFVAVEIDFTSDSSLMENTAPFYRQIPKLKLV